MSRDHRTPERCDGSRDLEHAVEEFTARLPEPLHPLSRLVWNYRWTWMKGAASVFRDLDRDLWRRSACNPRGFIEALPPRRIQEMAGDPDYVKRVSEFAARFDADLARPPSALPIRPEQPVAYFCSEFGAHCSLPIYGGGLGVLAGDVLKAASDAAIPLLGVGILYRQGYFHQRLDVEGWQHEYWTETAFERLPAVLVCDARGEPITVELAIRGRDVQIRVWRIDFGRVPLYLLDTDVPENHPIDRWITARLYIGDRHTRLAQYAVLGAGGVLALRAMGIEPGLVHLNEGHAALASLERASALLADGLTLDAALEQVRRTTVFTTHTPVAAGNDFYRQDEVEPVLGGFPERLEIPAADFYGVGRSHADDPNEPIGVTPLALRTAGISFGVSRRHGQVARSMWQGLWPEREVDDVPIGHVTNGVHVPSWMADAMQELLDRHLPGDWRERCDDSAVFEAIGSIPDEEIWAVRCRLRGDLVERARELSVRQRLERGEGQDYVDAAARVFDPDALTIGFARRVATYKRLHLLTRDLARSIRIVSNRERPVQFVIAGKAHPSDREAKETLRAILAVRGAPDIGSHAVFFEDYDLHLAPRIVSGVDLWLNLPRPPLEASGTSGMKVALNGGLNLSVLDGWWEEAYDGENGWAVASQGGNDAEQDERDSIAVYNVLENEVIPLYYDRDARGLPHRWLARVRASMGRLIPRFSAARMMRDYARDSYAPQL